MSRRAAAPAPVLCVSAFPDLGGAEHNLLDTIAALTARGVPVEVLNLVDQPGALAHALRARDVPLHLARVGRFRDPRGAVRAVRWLRRHAGRFAVTLANDTRAALYTALAARLSRVRYVWHVHDLMGGADRLQRVAIRLRPDAWIANSGAVAASLVARGCPPARVHVVHNGVDVTRFDPSVRGDAVRRELGADATTLLVGAVGRLVPWKGVETLLEAAERLTDVVPGATYVVVGDVLTDTANHAAAVRYRESLLALRDRLRLGARVRFLGARSDLPAIMSALDILVHGAINEPFGRVLIEAMAAGTPVVAALGGGVSEIVEDGETGYVVPPRDAGAVADRIVRLVDGERRSTMGRAARRRAVEHFSLQAYGDGMAAVIGRVAGTRAAPSVHAPVGAGGADA